MDFKNLDKSILKDYGTSVVRFEPSYGSEAIDAALVLEGGSMRSLFTAGVLDVFLENGLDFKRVIGVSAGALMGLNYVAGLIGRGAYINMKYCPDWRYFSLRSFALTGNMFNRSMSFDLIPNYLDPFPIDALKNSPMALTAVATDVETGEAVYMAVTPDDPYTPLMATSSQPLVSTFVDLADRKLLDGGCADSVPVRYALLNGATKVVVVCTKDKTYVRPPNPLMPLIATRYHNYPQFVRTIEERPRVYNETYELLRTLHRQKEAFVLWPPEPVTIKNDEHDPQALLDLYSQGVQTALENLEAIKSYLQ